VQFPLPPNRPHHQSTTTPQYKPHVPRMVNLNATTPQLKAVKRVVDTYGSRDLNSATIFSKNFKFQSFPKTTDHVEEAKGEHVNNYGGVVSSYATMEVSIWSRRQTYKASQADICRPSPYITKLLKHPEKLSSTFVSLCMTITSCWPLT
jgi:hypothetical protein